MQQRHGLILWVLCESSWPAKCYPELLGGQSHTQRHIHTTFRGSDISTCLIVPEEVVKHIKLVPEQNEWCTVSEEAAPHVSLRLHAGYWDKHTNPLTKRLTNVTDWNNTQIPQVLFSPSQGTYDYSLHQRRISIETLLHLWHWHTAQIVMAHPLIGLINHGVSAYITSSVHIHQTETHMITKIAPATTRYKSWQA